MEKIIPTEHQEQVALVQWMRLQHPAHWIFAVPNGGTRNKAEAQNLRREGVTAGVPDLFIPSLKLFIEMKRKKGSTVSKEQKEWMSYLSKCGYRAEICGGFVEAKNLIMEVVNDEKNRCGAANKIS